MAAEEGKRAEDVFAASENDNHYALGKSAAFVCPFPQCNAYSQHYWGNVYEVTFSSGGRAHSREYSSYGGALTTAKCELCEKEAIFLDGKLLHPPTSDAPPPTKDMPPELIIDFNEARQILPKSPRGSAALLRLVIQKLCKILGAEAKEINAAIGELVSKQIINPQLQKALDSVRVIGNEAVHPGVLDLKDDTQTVHLLFRLVNLIVEKGISEPKQIEEIYGGLPPNKLAGIESRDKVDNNSDQTK